jgi:DNA helicase-2/ATP-dependent DNA helicase PcrA
MKISYSQYQTDIFHEGQHGEGNVAISAAAGSGKTFTIVELANMMKKGKDIIFLAFNSHIKKELEAKLPKYIQAKTFHALGYAALAKALPRGAKVDCIKQGSKIRDKCFDVVKERNTDFKWEQTKEKASVLADICDLARNTLTDYKNVQSVTEMCAQYGIEWQKHDMNELCAWAAEIIEWGVDNFYKTGECDFVEMLYIPYKDHLDIPQFDMMLIDECQDMNPLQIGLIQMIAHNGTRVIMVGDPFQAIYGFTGALSDSFHRLRDAFNAKEMPLSICYRCPISHIKIARLYDGGRTEWAPNAIEGEVHYITQDKIPDHVKSQDLIICRLTAPLLGIAVKLIARRIAAVVLGRNIGAQITKYVDEVMKTSSDQEEADWGDFVERLEAYTNFNKEKIAKQRNPEFQLEMLNDKYECILTCYNSPGFNTTSVTEFKKSIESLFSDKKSFVTLATVHRVKGLEANRTFVIVDKAGAEVMPLRWKGQLDWQFQQEMNIAYVAFTRAKQEMFICCSNDTVVKNYKEKFAKTIAFVPEVKHTEKSELLPEPLPVFIAAPTEEVVEHVTEGVEMVNFSRREKAIEMQEAENFFGRKAHKEKMDAVYNDSVTEPDKPAEDIVPSKIETKFKKKKKSLNEIGIDLIGPKLKKKKKSFNRIKID